MRTDEGIQLHLFDMDKYGDTIDEDRIIFVAKTKSHIEFTSLPFHGNPDAKYCITEVGGYGGISTHKWLVIKIKNRKSSEPTIFNSMIDAIEYMETLTGKIVRFRKEG